MFILTQVSIVRGTWIYLVSMLNMYRQTLGYHALWSLPVATSGLQPEIKG